MANIETLAVVQLNLDLFFFLHLYNKFRKVWQKYISIEIQALLNAWNN